MYEHLKVSFQLQIKNNIFGSDKNITTKNIILFYYYTISASICSISSFVEPLFFPFSLFFQPLKQRLQLQKSLFELPTLQT